MAVFCVLTALFASILATTATAPPVSALTETLTSSNVSLNGTSWRQINYTPTQTGSHTFTFAKSNPNAVTGSELRTSANNTWVASNSPASGATQNPHY